VDALDVETCSGPEARDALSHGSFGERGTREFLTHVRFHKHDEDRVARTSLSSCTRVLVTQRISVPAHRFGPRRNRFRTGGHTHVACGGEGDARGASSQKRT
jgi:hypothetical protein